MTFPDRDSPGDPVRPLGVWKSIAAAHYSGVAMRYAVWIDAGGGFRRDHFRAGPAGDCASPRPIVRLNPRRPRPANPARSTYWSRHDSRLVPASGGKGVCVVLETTGRSVAESDEGLWGGSLGSSAVPPRGCVASTRSIRAARGGPLRLGVDRSDRRRWPWMKQAAQLERSVTWNVRVPDPGRPCGRGVLGSSRRSSP